MKKVDRTKGIKVWAKALALAAFALAPCVVEAGVTRSQTIGTTSRRKLEGDTVYLVTSDLEIRAASGFSALSMDANSTSVLYVATGKTLTLQGGNASGTAGAGAGIEIPSSSLLIITGGGTIKATGGKGANGSSGGNGGDGVVIDDDDDPKDEWGHAGKGGSGGSGGGGAGAGIGGRGGSAGPGRDEPESTWLETDGPWKYAGYGGYSGYGGNAGGSGGNLYVLGTANVTAIGGSQGANGGSAGSSGGFDIEYWWYSYRAGGGGGGGGGGSGCAASNFGGGGGGGGAGGGGGQGGTYWTTQGYTERKATGGNGGGGSGGVGGSGTRTDGTEGWFDGNGGNGGSGGSKGATGSAGTAYKAAAATFSGASSTTAVETHPAIEYSVIFDDGSRLTTNLLAKFGYAYPNAPTSHRYGYAFKGWYTGKDGLGTRCYDENGSPVIDAWTRAGDLTLYPKWERNSDDLSYVTLWINGDQVVEGTNASGDGWTYEASTGKINITGNNKTYEIRGCDADGFAQIMVKADCTVKISDQLEMAPGTRSGYIPISIAKGSFASDAVLEVEEGAHCSLTGASGCPAIYVNPSETFMGTDNTLLIKARGALDVTGGEGAADIGLRPNDPIAGCGKIYVETYDNWFSNIRPGHGVSDKNGLVNNKGHSARFYSQATGKMVYSVRMSFAGVSSGEKTIYRQRILGEVKDTVKPDGDGHVWLWMPSADYEWGEKANASYEDGDKIWTATVSGGHTAATAFTPLDIKVNGEDIAHRVGPGWYTTFEGGDTNKVSLTITNAGPHVVTGSGNVNIDLMCDMSLTVSNLTLDVESRSGKCAIWLADGVTLDLTVKGTNTLSSSSAAPGIAVYSGRTINIDGDGWLSVQGGKNATGIGGGMHGTSSGRINISGGEITAIGGANAAGIGSGQTSSRAGDITISGGKVTARGGQYAAAIGGGHTGYANVVITGGTVFPTAGTKASAIGNGYGATGSGNNTFGFAAIYAAKDAVSPAAKNGNGKAVFPASFDMGLPRCNVTNIVIEDEVKTCKDLWTDANGKLTLWLEPTDGNQYTITITAVDSDSDETVKSWGYKMDDSGNAEFSSDMLTVDGIPVVGGKPVSATGWEYNAGSGILAISSGDHTITGNSTNGTINIVVTGDGVTVTLESLILKTSNDRQSPFVVSNSCTVMLSGDNTIECRYWQKKFSSEMEGSEYTAAIEVPKGASLAIEGDGTLIANGGISGAGIGSRGSKVKGGSLDAGSITINGGYIYATGGWGKTGGGAGIGGGVGGGVASVLVNGGYVHATGGKNACGIGTGYDGPLLADSTFHVTGGTVLVEKGDGSFSDFDTACGSVISPTGSKSIVIDGGSVRPKNFYGNANPEPNPVNSNGVQLVYAVIEGVGIDEGDSVSVIDDLWPHYSGVDIYADEEGMICIWGERTNVVRSVEIRGAGIDGGMAVFDISAASNTVQSAKSGGVPDSREIDGKTCWRVEVHALPAKTRMNVTGVEAYVRGVVTSDYTGKLNIYLPDGEHDFKVGDYSYHASVAGATTVATYEVGIRINGVDIGTERGTGWTYNGTEERLTLESGAAKYALSGTNSERSVSVYVTAAGVTVRFDRLSLKAAGAGPFCLENASATLEFASGTLSAGDVFPQVTVSGGTFNTRLENAVARTDSGSYTNAYRVTVSGLAPSSLVEIEDIEGLDRYDTYGIYSDASGAVHLYLPDGEYYFRVRCGGAEKEMVVVVEGGDATAVEYIPTGVVINGRDAARLIGEGWRNEDGLVRLHSATSYVVSGTNDGEAVTLSVERSGATLTLDNLVMTNALMLASPILLGNGQRASFAIELVGTNILRGVASGVCGVELCEMTYLEFTGDGRLEAQGAGPGIGTGPAGVPDGTSITVMVRSGEIVATGGDRAAGIGGGPAQAGITTYIYGGVVTAQGGSGGAGIGGGDGGRGASVIMTNGVVNATGGDGGAGIGGGKDGFGGSVMVSGGARVTATGVDGASGIGGGQHGAPGIYRQSGGTVFVSGSDGGADIGNGLNGDEDASKVNVVTGGSLKSSSTKVSPSAKNALGDKVYCVTVPTGRPNFDVGAVMADYDGYPLTGVKTDDEGKIYIWLPDGTYYITLGGVPYRAVVDGADTEAETWAVGVTVNGEDVALRFGEGWTYDVERHALSVTNDGCVVSGTNTVGGVYLDCTNDVSMVISNLVITSSSQSVSPFEISSNAAVTVMLAGENSFTSLGKSRSAIHVPETATLVITNLDTVISVPDLDNIQHITNTVESIEAEDDGYGNITIVTNYVDIVTVVTNYYDATVSGALTATGAENGAGIGGGYMESYGTIWIDGGEVVANGGYNGAGIGSGCITESQEDDVSTVISGALNIRGGRIHATGGRYGAGLGGGNLHSGGRITVSGGTVVAQGGDGGAGIGGGWNARASTIEISGGTVTAKGGAFGGAGIGGGNNGSEISGYDELRTVTISGGIVTAVGGSTGGAGIGSASYDHCGMKVTITGGTVFTTGGSQASLTYGSDDIGTGGHHATTPPKLYPLTIRGASVHATRRTASNESVSPAPSNGTERVWCVTVETSKTNELVRVDYLNGFGEGSDIYADADGRIYLWLPDGSYVFYVADLPVTATVNGADTVATTWLTGVTVDGVDVSFRRAKKWGYDYESKTLGIIGDCVVSGRNTAGLVNILAVPDGELSFTISNLYLRATEHATAPPFAVTNGIVTIRLAGTNTFDATETDDYAGLNVVSPATLVITNLEETASLIAYSGEDAAAIGGNQRKNSSVNYTTGTIRINGGMIYARAKDTGAGIGSGYKGRSGDIYISGGQIEAYGGEYTPAFSTCCGAGIGGGDSAFVDSGRNKIVFSGGTVIARGGCRNSAKYAADIGTGYEGSGVYSVEISGGSVHPGADSEDQNFNQSERGNIYPVNSADSQVFKVTHEGFAPYAKVDLVMDGYGSNDIYADAAGKVYVWLANGVYYYSIDGQRYATKMEDGTATTVRIPDAYGVEVDGVDVVNLTGDKWIYDVFSCQLSVTNACVISGTNTDGKVNISVDATEAFALTISNLYLKATGGSPITVLHGTNTLCLVGTNVLDAADAAGHPGLHVATLYEGVVITNLHDGAMLVAKGGENAAGIGGDKSENAGDITITGGIVDAKGGDAAAGIGGGYQHTFGTIRISGGNVTAESAKGGAGIGSGKLSSGGTVEISGGVVSATANTTGAGIGSGGFLFDSVPGSGGTITISGGEVVARSVSNSSGLGGAGIGGGNMCKGGNITITGGRVTASGGERGAGIGGGSGQPAERIVISGGTVFPTAGQDAMDVGHGYNPSGNLGTVVFSGGSVKTVVSRTSPAPLNALGMAVNRIGHDGFARNAKVEVELPGYGSNDIYADADGWIYLWLPLGESYYSVNGQRYAAQVGINSSTVIGIPAAYGVEVDGVDVASLSGDTWSYNVFSNRLSVTNACVISGRDTSGRINISVDATAEYALTISNLYLQAESGSPIDIVAGMPTLCLVGTNVLDAADADDYPGLHVGMLQGIVITNLHDGAKLVAKGGAKAAGIGGDNSENAGKIAIAGGIVEATGGSYGAGIGGGRKYGFAEISITAGTVTPVGGTGAKAIGYGSANESYIGSEKIVFTGGSIATSAENIGAQATTKVENANGENIYPVSISGFTPYAKVDMEIEGYNARGVYADGEGKIYPWLAEGDYIFILDGVPHLAHVTSSGAVAEPWLSGVTANGTDLAYLHDENGQWAYNFRKRTLYILSGTSPADCVTVSGTNTADYVYVEATNDVYFAISNLNLKTTSAAPVALVCANATVAFAGTNTLDASGASQYAALQSRTAQSAWTSLVLTNLNEGATLVAKGGSGGAGIGCGSTSSSSYCKVYVYGGNITAEGGLNGSGIGGGANGSSEVYIYGGRVTAAGGSYAAGIGGGKDSQGTVEIHGGTVDATATAGGGAGIGGGANGDGTVSVIDGAVTACGNGLGAGIGGGSGGKGYVYVSGGSVKPIAGTYAASKSVGNGNTTGGEVLFTGGSIHTTVAYVNPAASNANHVAVWPVSVTGLKAGSEITFDGLPSSYGTKGICADEDGKVRLWLPNGDYAFTATDDDGIARLYVAPVADAPADATYSAMTGFTVNGCDVAYLSGEGWSYKIGAVNGGITLSGLDHYELSGALTNKYLTISNSCSIVFSNVVFNSYNVDTQHGIVNIAGAYDVNLTIEGVNSVKAPSGGYLAGIRVPTGATLTIDGDGSLESTAGPYAAGIGGGRNSGCGAITINGGTVTATGGNYAAGIGGGGPDAVFAGTITINGGTVTATGGSYAAGIGGGGESAGGSVEITGGRVNAASGSGGGACIGAGKNGTYGDVVISGGTVVASTDEYRTHAIGDGFGTDGFGKVTITGGSVNAAYDGVTPAPSNGTEAVYCVTVSDLVPSSAVAFDGLPTYYGTSNIYADSAGKVYLWLPENWETTHPVTPHLLTSAHPRLGASSGTAHTFAANGYSYTVTIPEGGGNVAAEKGAVLELEGLRITDFVAQRDCICLRVEAKPETWLYGFVDSLVIRASAALPIPATDESILDLSGGNLELESDGTAVFTVPLDPDAGYRFFTIERRSTP